MLFIVNWKTNPVHRDTAVARFKATGGAPPAGAKMLGRWHNADESGGFLICETEDATALAAWMHQWTDVLVFDARPAITDEQFGKILASA
jgi:hypothetical protein